MTQFTDLGLSAPILKALADEGYTTPTPIQLQAIPIVLGGSDLIGLAQTGTGKTAAFALPILDRLHQNRRHAGARSCRTLVLAPTRELAAQIADSFRAYGKFLGLSTAVVFGGASMFKQKQALERGVDILVATPGRLLDHISQRSLKLEKVEILVLDEADHMLDMGFIHDLRKIAKLIPVERQSLFFSATMPAPIAELAQQFLTAPERVAVTPVSSTAERVAQSIIHVAADKKQDLLHSLLKDKTISRALVFARTKHGADRVVKKLEEAGFPAEAIHGNKSQGQRERALLAFKKGQARLLVATEIAARGIDVDEVSHVINFDLPNVPEQYVHRIGRTARAGQAGEAISFCQPDERAYLRDIEKVTKQAVPVRMHELSLPTPQPGDRVPRPPAPGQKRQGQGQGQRQGQRPGFGQGQGERRPDRRGERPSYAPRGEGAEQSAERSDRPQRKPQAANAHAPSHPREKGARDHAARDNGDRRDRKGNDLWSNGPAPRSFKPRAGGPKPGAKAGQRRQPRG